MNQQGSIVVRVTLANESLPVTDAVVTATMGEEENKKLLGVRKTNENGQTSEIFVDTPDIEYSLEPENQVIPFASVDLKIEHPSVYTVIIKNVQVFSGNQSVVNVSLIPLPDGVANGEQVIDITPQNL